MSRIPVLLLASSLFAGVACKGGGEGDGDKDTGASGAGAGDTPVCSAVGIACRFGEPSDETTLCLEVVNYGDGADFETTFADDCAAEGGSPLTGGCPTDGLVCTLIGAEVDGAASLTHVYGSGVAVDATCEACVSGDSECC